MSGREVYDGTWFCWRAHVVPARKKWRVVVERQFGRHGWEVARRTRRFKTREQAEAMAHRILDSKIPLSDETVV